MLPNNIIITAPLLRSLSIIQFRISMRSDADQPISLSLSVLLHTPAVFCPTGGEPQRIFRKVSRGTHGYGWMDRADTTQYRESIILIRVIRLRALFNIV